jgi:hypothetical protein
VTGVEGPYVHSHLSYDHRGLELAIDTPLEQ